MIVKGKKLPPFIAAYTRESVEANEYPGKVVGKCLLMDGATPLGGLRKEFLGPLELERGVGT